MVKVYKGKNPLYMKAAKWYAGGIAIALPMIALAYNKIATDMVLFLLGAAVAGIALSITWPKGNMYLSGSIGEYRVLRWLKKEVPDGSVIFTSVRVHERMESDIVVVSPIGVFIIEVKNYNGDIEGSDGKENWILHKTGRKGGHYTAKVRNPQLQLKRNTFIVAEFLRQKGMRQVWVEGFTVFTGKGSFIGCIPDRCMKGSRECMEVIIHCVHQLNKNRGMLLSEDQIEKAAGFLMECVQDEPAMKQDDFEATLQARKNSRRSVAGR